ncbi:MAG: hypothetical protein H0W40_08995 [Methylibium sp.]|uniref:hypothetical protein n=1 Tax=Methylibium sp. TaxID=2067992 RepID=UPI0017EF6C7A|nr:hypothetical protein [Methylibium sp.]MBA3597502.1 hypothetical protein [Methylibium sp.]
MNDPPDAQVPKEELARAQRMERISREIQETAGEQRELVRRTAEATEALARDAADAKRDSHKAVMWARLGALIALASLLVAAWPYISGL